MEERLQKLLAQAGLCSRREAERWIDDGRVTVNGKKASVGDKADPRRDKIFVDGKPIGGAEEKVYLMLYKPRGYVTTMKDEHGRKTVADLVRGCGARVVPVGRLDYNSEGLLLLTNDGDLLNALTHPRHEVEKHYEVRVRGNLDNISKLAEPMEIDGYSIRPATVVTIDRDEISAKLRLTIHEGRNRQIRKMCEKCGLEVRRLKRVAMGTMPLDPHLKSGAWRELTNDEIAYLQDIAADVQDGAIPHNYSCGSLRRLRSRCRGVLRKFCALTLLQFHGNTSSITAKLRRVRTQNLLANRSCSIMRYYPPLIF